MELTLCPLASGCIPQQDDPLVPARVRVAGLRLARNGNAIAALPDFELTPGRSLAMIGLSGCGKTTALMALALMHRPEAGRIMIDVAEPWAFSCRARDRFRGSHIGLVFQSFHLVDESESAGLVVATHDRRVLDAVDEVLTIGEAP